MEWDEIEWNGMDGRMDGQNAMQCNGRKDGIEWNGMKWMDRAQMDR